MRCFIAIDIDDKIRKKIVNLQDELKGLKLSLTKEENFHFTLKFLDDIEDKDIDYTKNILENICSKTKPFKIKIESVGVFPNDNFIRVVWIGAPLLEPFMKIVYENVKIGKKDFDPHPHLTLARNSSNENNKEILKFLAKNKDIEIGEMTVKEIKLKKSTLAGSKGAIYEDLYVFKLKG